jgi:glycosyltransferase involved in cell wall biosynthesis
VARRFAHLTTITPELHYSEFLIQALERAGEGDRIVPIVRAGELAAAAAVSDCTPLIWKSGVGFSGGVHRQIERAAIDLLHVQFEPRMYGGWLSGWHVARLLRLAHRRMPTVLTMHAVVPRTFFADDAASRVAHLGGGIQKRLAWTVVRQLHRELARHSDKVIVHLAHLKDILVEDYDVPADKVEVIRHGVLPGPFDEPQGAGSELSMLAPGYVAPRKGLETLVEAISLVASDVRERLRVSIAGYERNAEYGLRLRTLTRERGVERNISFVGPFSRTSLHQLLSQARAVILPYALAYSASGPLALAAAYSVPVIAPTLPTFVEEREAGLGIMCFEAGSAAGLARSIEEMAAAPGVAARCRALMNSARPEREWSEIAGQTLAVYRSLL